MSSVETFGVIVLAAAVVCTVAVLSNRFSERLRIPAPAIFLICAAVAAEFFPGLNTALSTVTVEDIVSIALAIILFDGGMHIGWRRFRSAAGPIVWVGIVGTFLTTGAFALLAHEVFGFGWLPALILGTALAPTDPAVVFSVLGRREVAGRTGTILEGESGVNDPVGIALMVSLLAATGTGASFGGQAASVGVTFVVQMVVGAAIGIAGGILLMYLMRRVALPSEGLYALRTLAGALVLYGAATAAGGSGFLAVFVAGIVIGDGRAPYKREIERFHSSLASLAEIVAFIVLGLTINLDVLGSGGTWWIGLALAALLGLLIRPVLVGLLLLPIRLRAGERIFVLWAGLKGAVPILLGTLVVVHSVPGAQRLYHVIFVVVAFSVVAQGALVPAIAGKLGVPMHTVEPEPWALGVRLQHEPEGVRSFVVARGSPADGCAISDLPVGEDVWVSFVIRGGSLVQVRGETTLQAGDQVMVLADPDLVPEIAKKFHEPADRQTEDRGAGTEHGGG
ncbi:MAG: potassium/proton antiporter [Streptosporangiaceae bacterium]